MCGIAGVISNNESRIDPSTPRGMTDALTHRGPDEDGFWHSDLLSVGMRRLSIIDIEGGTQPIWASPHHGVIFNGEIYNYRSLRSQLEKKGHVFDTETDTEVIVRLYIEEGHDFLLKLNGMFTICLIDLKRKEVILGRDRYGEKPLYYTNQPDFFFFASEIKALEKGTGTMPALNREAISHYLTLRFVPEPMTMWDGIYKLPPGHFITYDLNTRSYTLRRYWSSDFCSDPYESGRDYVNEFRDLFLSSVNQRILAADVPVGIMLSGGLDSTLIALAAKEAGHDSVHTFSVGYAEEQFSELDHAAQVASYFGTEHQAVQYSYETFLAHLPDYIWDTDEPLGDSAGIPLRYLCRFARQEVKVALTGEGADELFAGYNLDNLARKATRFERLLAWMPRSFFHIGKLLHGRQNDRRKAFIQMAREGWGAYLTAMPAYPSRFWTESEKSLLFPDLEAAKSTDDLIREWYSTAQSPDPLDKYMTVASQNWLTEDLLMKADKMSMRESLELRCPFLDYPLAEWAQRLPKQMKVGNSKIGYTTKAVLRQFGLNRVPEEIVHRPKQGFSNPTNVWIEENLEKWVGLVQSESSALRTVLGMSSESGLDREMHDNIEKLWLLVLLELWLRRWVLAETYEDVDALIKRSLG